MWTVCWAKPNFVIFFELGNVKAKVYFLFNGNNEV